MVDNNTLGPWIKRFLLEYLTGERNLARNTQRSYRDTIRLLILFLAASVRKQVEDLLVIDLSDDRLREFLIHIEQTRKCGASTRNQRLAAIHALARFIAQRNPECLAWCAEIGIVAFKKVPIVPITYLEKNEMDALLDAPDQSTILGHRDHALLLFLYNSGARAEEVASLAVGDLTLQEKPSGQSFVRLHGKGNKVRSCPLWTSTAAVLKALVVGRASEGRVFVNRCGQPLTRFGVHEIVTRHARSLQDRFPELHRKRPTPHTIRHTCATHLLRAGVDINTIRAWLGHVSLNTTNVYAEVDLEMKAQALAKCAVAPSKRTTRWRDRPGLLAFLQSL
jgi:site-specific recombinase XerD